MIKKTLIVLLLALACIKGYSQSEVISQGNLQDVDVVRIGLVLPFVNKSEGKSARFIEYYEGFLLALEELKTKGFSANVYVFDMGSETGVAKLESLLETSEMRALDLIIGGFSPEQVNVLSDFAEMQGIKYVIPFPTKKDETQRSTRIFQINAPYEVVCENTAETLADLFGAANVVYVAEDENSARKEFITSLNTQLEQRGMLATGVVANQNLIANLSLALDPNRRNVIVASSGSLQLLQALLPALNSIREQQPDINWSLFGHTEWQAYTQYYTSFYKNDTYICTPFYLVNDDYKTKQFISNYKRWYNNKSLINTYPKYGVLGYDTAIYFLTALFEYGKDFESSINSVSVPTLQMPISFDKANEDSGYMNEGFYVVHYQSNGVTDKTEYGK